MTTPDQRGSHQEIPPTEQSTDLKKTDHTEIIKARLDKVVQNPEIREMVAVDYSYTFHELGLSTEEARTLAEKVIGMIAEAKTLKEAETNIRATFETTRVGEHNFFELIQAGLGDRVRKIVDQVSPFLIGVGGKVFDYGMGAGEVTQKLKDELNLDIEGGDVRDFRSPEVTVPYVLLSSSPDESGRIVDVEDKHYEAAVVTNVIHHERVNENILRELERIVGKKLVIIETVPVGNTPEEIAKDHERTFANDTLWNRFFNYADIPVPGTYETPQDWIKRFEKHGWRTTHSEDLGYDQKSIHDVHHLLVFER